MLGNGAGGGRRGCCHPGGFRALRNGEDGTGEVWMDLICVGVPCR